MSIFSGAMVRSLKPIRITSNARLPQRGGSPRKPGSALRRATRRLLRPAAIIPDIPCNVRPPEDRPTAARHIPMTQIPNCVPHISQDASRPEATVLSSCPSATVPSSGRSPAETRRQAAPASRGCLLRRDHRESWQRGLCLGTHALRIRRVACLARKRGASPSGRSQATALSRVAAACRYS